MTTEAHANFEQGGTKTTETKTQKTNTLKRSMVIAFLEYCGFWLGDDGCWHGGDDDELRVEFKERVVRIDKDLSLVNFRSYPNQFFERLVSCSYKNLKFTPEGMPLGIGFNSILKGLIP